MLMILQNSLGSFQWYNSKQWMNTTGYNFTVETTTDKFGIGGINFLNKGENYINSDLLSHSMEQVQELKLLLVV